MKKVLHLNTNTLGAYILPELIGDVPTQTGYINGYHVMAVDGG